MNFLSFEAQIIYEWLDSFTAFHFWYPCTPPPPQTPQQGPFNHLVPQLIGKAFVTILHRNTFSLSWMSSLVVNFPDLLHTHIIWSVVNLLERWFFLISDTDFFCQRKNVALWCPTNMFLSNLLSHYKRILSHVLYVLLSIG